MNLVTFSVVVPTIGRASLRACLDALVAAEGPAPDRVVVVDDRPGGASLDLPSGVQVLRGAGRGPAAARNVGWRATDTPWVVFVDDDVVVGPRWRAELAADLAAADDRTAAVQGRLDVPLPADRRPTDWERNVAALASARWITADLAVRRDSLTAAGGFDARFRRAYREDADLALRLLDAGYRLVRGERRSTHPVRPAPWWVSLRNQAGNADDPMMRRLHGRDWHRRAGVPSGRRPRHLATTAAGAAALLALALGRRRTAALLAAGWVAATAELAAARIAPGPHTPSEIARMVVTSVLLSPLATVHWLRGLGRATRVPRRQ